jgi:hypothetical protein
MVRIYQGLQYQGCQSDLGKKETHIGCSYMGSMKEGSLKSNPNEHCNYPIGLTMQKYAFFYIYKIYF